MTITGVSGSLTHSTTIALTVNSSVGLQTATFDSTLKAPDCVGRRLGLRLRTVAAARPRHHVRRRRAQSTQHHQQLLRRWHVRNFPLRRIQRSPRRSTTDGSTLAPGKTVKVSATVWAYSGFTSDHLDLYYAANASSPSWVLIGTITPTAAGAQTLSANYTLPSGGASQAVRAQFRYHGSASSCTTGLLQRSRRSGLRRGRRNPRFHRLGRSELGQRDSRAPTPTARSRSPA